MNFKRIETGIRDLIVVEPRKFGDSRGFFMEAYKKSSFEEIGIEDSFVQVNHSRSQRGVLRGLHYQNNPDAQSKLVRVLDGEVFDVAVDIRKGSPTYGKWYGVNLSSDNNLMMYIPGGFAHGFCVLSETADFLYSCGSEYAPQSEAGLKYDDKEVGIEWPTNDVLLSDKDLLLPSLKEMNCNFIYEV